MKTAEPITITGIYDLLLSGWSWVPDLQATLRDLDGNLWNVYNRRDRSYLFPVRDTAMQATPPSDRK